MKSGILYARVNICPLPGSVYLHSKGKSEEALNRLEVRTGGKSFLCTPADGIECYATSAMTRRAKAR